MTVAQHSIPAVQARRPATLPRRRWRPRASAAQPRARGARGAAARQQAMKIDQVCLYLRITRRVRLARDRLHRNQHGVVCSGQEGTRSAEALIRCDAIGPDRPNKRKQVVLVPVTHACIRDRSKRPSPRTLGCTLHFTSSTQSCQGTKCWQYTASSRLEAQCRSESTPPCPTSAFTPSALSVARS